MPDLEPVLVVHGVANRDRQEFTDRVDKLNAEIGASYKFIAVYWGDLGARADNLQYLLPEETENVRGPSPHRDDAAKRVYAGVSNRLQREGSPLPPDLYEDIQEAIDATWSDLAVIEKEDELVYSHTLDTIEEEIYRSVSNVAAVAETSVVRSRAGNVIKGIARAAARGAKQAYSALREGFWGDVNQQIRSAFLRDVCLFLGDIFVYQRNRAAFHQAIRTRLATEAPGYGTKEKPISVIAHSLGGVICFDAAVSGEPPLWMKRFITLGSQSALFHLVDPRSDVASNNLLPTPSVPDGSTPTRSDVASNNPLPTPSAPDGSTPIRSDVASNNPLPLFSPGNKVPLPPTIAKWVNIHEPLDPLAYLAARVFGTKAGQVVDRKLSHIGDSGFYTHNCYWQHHESINWIADALI